MAARDHFGVKPLYWCGDGRGIAVASEIGALLAAGLVRAEVDEVALDHFLACRFVPPRGPSSRGSRSSRRSVLVVGDDRPPQVHSFREPPGETMQGSESALADPEQGRPLRADAVERQMMSDVPYGAFLSGGVELGGRGRGDGRSA